MKKIAAIVLFMLVGVVYADQIPSLKTWVASESYKAADMNANFAKIRSIVNGLLREDNFPSGFTIPASWVAHLTWPSHGSSHAAAGTDPLATDTTYLVGNIAATNATFTNVTAAQVTGTQMTATGITATNATFTTVAATNANVSGTITGGNVSAIHGAFSGNLSAAGNATFSKGICITGNDDSSYGLTMFGTSARGYAANWYVMNTGVFNASQAFSVYCPATFTSTTNMAYANIASLSANQVRVASLTINDYLRVNDIAYFGAGAQIDGLNVNNYNILNVAIPTLATHGANKGYVDSIVTSATSVLGVSLGTVAGYGVASSTSGLPCLEGWALASASYTLVSFVASYTNSTTATKTIAVTVPYGFSWRNDIPGGVTSWYRGQVQLVASSAYWPYADSAVVSGEYLDQVVVGNFMQSDSGTPPAPGFMFIDNAQLVGIARVAPGTTAGFGLSITITISGDCTSPYFAYIGVLSPGGKLIAW